MLNDGVVEPSVADAIGPAATAAASGNPDAAVERAAGPAVRASRGAVALAVAEGRPRPTVRGWPFRATTCADPRAISALPAAADVAPAGGRAADRRTAALGATVAIRLATDLPEAAGAAASRGFWAEAWLRFRRRKIGIIALVYVVLMALVAIFSPAIAGTKPVVCRYKGKLYFPARSVEERANGDRTTNVLRDIILNGKLDSDLFSFEVPDSVTVVDMR